MVRENKRLRSIVLDQANPSKKASVQAAAAALADRLLEEASALAPNWANQAADLAEANEGFDKCPPKQGGVLTASDSQHILRLYFSLVRKLMPPCDARKEVCSTLGVGERTVTEVLKFWRENREFLQKSGRGHGAVKEGQRYRWTCTTGERSEGALIRVHC